MAELFHVSEDGAIEVPVPPDRVSFGESMASRALHDVADSRLERRQLGARRLLSATPFQEHGCANRQFRDAVWQAFKEAVSKANDTTFEPTADLPNHFLARGCYALTQSRTQRRGPGGTVVQLSNASDRWAVGSAPTVAGDAASAVLAYLITHVMRQLFQRW